MTKAPDTDFDVFTAKLLAHREEILTDEEVGKSTRPDVELDQTRIGRLSRMDALQGAAMWEETERRRKVELQRIEAALHRMESGEYGYCVSCGDKIAPKRLESDPAIPTCIACANRATGH